MDGHFPARAEGHVAGQSRVLIPACIQVFEAGVRGGHVENVGNGGRDLLEALIARIQRALGRAPALQLPVQALRDALLLFARQVQCAEERRDDDANGKQQAAADQFLNELDSGRKEVQVRWKTPGPQPARPTAIRVRSRRRQRSVPPQAEARAAGSARPSGATAPAPQIRTPAA